MNKNRKSIIRKYAGLFWLLAVGITFAVVYYLTSTILKTFAIEPDIIKTICVSISSLVSIIMYIVIAIWGVRNL